MIRTYKFSGKFINERKQESIFELGKEYKKYYNDCVQILIQHNLYKDCFIPKYIDRLEKGKLSERYKQTCGSQVVSTVNSWISNVKNRVKDLITHSKLKDAEKMIYYYINKYHLWFKKEVNIKGNSVSEEYLRNSRKMFKKVMGRLPVMRNITMNLDAKTMRVEKNENTSFDYWVKIATLKKGKPIYLPLRSYEYFENKNGNLKNSIQVLIKDNRIEVGIIKDTVYEKLADLKGEIGIDMGMCSLLTSSSGNQYGRQIFDKLKKYDKIIVDLVSGRQKDKLKPMCRKLERLYKKVRGLLKNETNRCINNLIKKERPIIIDVEKLTGISKNTKKNMNLSKRMRRLLINSGMLYAGRRLKEKSEENGIKIYENNPAYTSCTCPRCGNVDKRNRKSQSLFKCTNCGYSRNADYIGGVNIRDRRSISKITCKSRPKEIFEILKDIFQQKQAVYSVAKTG